MGDIESELKNLLAGEVVSSCDVPDIKITSARCDELVKPVIKRTVTYIVMAMVFDDSGRVVLIQEAKEGCYGQWYPPAGRVEPGENLIDAVKREVKEEAGIDCIPETVVSVKLQQFNWVRIVYVAKSFGQPLKTIEDKDSESLQAGWFTVDEIKTNKVRLRYKDFFQSLDIAVRYSGLSSDMRHPFYNVGVNPFHHVIHRPVILRKTHLGRCSTEHDKLDSRNGMSRLIFENIMEIEDIARYDSIEVLCNIKRGGLFCCGASPHDNLTATLAVIFMEVFNLKFRDVFPTLKVKGLLTLEHCGVPARQHDGICVTTVCKVSKAEHGKLDKVTNSDYAWIQLKDQNLIEELNRRALSKNGDLLIPLI